MIKNTLSKNKILVKSLLAVVVGAGMSFSAASAAIVFDAVPEDTTASINRTIGSGVTVTGSNLNITIPGGVATPNIYVDPTASPWDGNLYNYIIASTSTNATGGGLGNITYAAAAGDYFTNFDARLIGNNGQIGSNASNVLPLFTFEGSTDGVNFSTINVTGTKITVAGGGSYNDWTRVSAVPTDTLPQFTHLRFGIDIKASGGASWHQQLGGVELEVAAIPEPSAALLGGLGMLLLLRRRR